MERNRGTRSRLRGAALAFALFSMAGSAIAQGTGNPTILEAIQALQATVNQLRAELQGVGAAATPKRYYLTKGCNLGDEPECFDGSQALSACAAGFHFASLWEIFDTSNLVYDTELGATLADSGFGPPTSVNIAGWIRTGTQSRVVGSLPGTVNCQAWTSASGSDGGTQVRLIEAWTLVDPSTSFERVGTLPWFGQRSSCNSGAPVWCVQD